MNTSSEPRNPVEILAEEYLDRKRRGESPTLSEYLERYPELAGEIRELFPALFMIEDLGEDSGGLTGSLPGDGVAAVGARLQKLGDYRILREVGRGGMGVVYEAEQESLGRRVALKVLSASALVDPNQIRRFEREARAAARLHHTNIVPVFGVGQQDGHHYYVMQFIAGLGLDLVLQDLRRLRRTKGDPQSDAVPEPQPRNRQGPSARVPERSKFGLTAADVARSLITGRHAGDDSARVGASTTEPFDGAGASRPRPMVSAGNRKADSSSVALPGSSELSAVSGSDRWYYQSVAKIGVQVAEALEYANRQGVLHRDIKPSNLLLDNRGNVWVADFGLAKTAEADNLTHTGDIVGTIRYMAPERFQGRCDARSDVYSLGLTLYELVALRPAYEAADRHTLMDRVLHEEPARLMKLAPMVPRDLETIIGKAIARDPAARYATPAALGEDLLRFVEDRPIRARRASLAEQAWRWSRRNKAMAALLAAVTTLLIVVTIGSTLFGVHVQGLSRTLQETNQTLESNLYFSDIDRANREWLLENPGHAEKLLDGCPAHLRGWEWHYLKRQSHTALLTIPVLDDFVLSAVYSPDGTRIATACQDGTARVFDPSSGRLNHELRGHSNICWQVAYSPDGTMLASSSQDRTVKVWDAASGRLLTTLGPHPSTVFGVDFSSGGRLLASSSQGAVKLWNTKTWREVRTFDGGWDVKFSPDGRLLATVYGDSGTFKGLIVWDVAALEGATGPVSGKFRHEGEFMYIAFSPDSRSIAAPLWVDKTHDVRILDAESGRTIRSLGGPTGAYSVTYSPDGRMLALGSQDRTVKVWDARTGELLHTFRGHTAWVKGIAFAPDSRRLVSSSLDGTIKVWDVANIEKPAGKATVTPPTLPGSVIRVVLSANGRSYARVLGRAGQGGGDGSKPADPPRVEAAMIWDASSGQKIRALAPAPGTCHDVALGPGLDRTAWARGDGAVEIRDETNRSVLTLSGHTGLVERVAYSVDNRRLASASRDGTVRVLDAVTGRLIMILPGFRDGTLLLGFSPDGRRLAVRGDELDRKHPAVLKVWEVATGRSLLTVESNWGELQPVAFDPRGERLASVLHGTDILVQSLENGREAIRLRGYTNLDGALAFSPDGRRLASASRNGTLIKLWDLSTGREVLSLLRERGDPVADAGCRFDGNRLVLLSVSGNFKVWDATPLAELSYTKGTHRD
jgi:WD40 repeat protein